LVLKNEGEVTARFLMRNYSLAKIRAKHRCGEGNGRYYFAFLFFGDQSMQKQNRLTKNSQDHQGIDETSKAHLRKIRYGAPDGPRRPRGEKCDGHEPLEYPGHEAVAQYLAAPKSLREFKSDSDLAKHFHVSRMTICRWRHDPDVIQRAHFLSGFNEMAGDLLARQEWPRIMQKVVQKAINGDLQSIKFCESRAWPNELRVEQSHLSATVSIQELLGTSESEDADEPADNNQQAQGDDR
jgi:hypothetical protein